MGEYIKREDAIKAVTYTGIVDPSRVVGLTLLTAQKNIRRIPAADVVEVVRCKDCFFGREDPKYHLGIACEKPLYHPLIGERPHRKLMQDCDYCSHGVRKEK